MKTYRIKLEFTNPYIGSKKGGNKTLETGLTLKVAQKKLLEMYNNQYSSERNYAKNWGLAVIQSSPYLFGANKTFSDRTRSYEWDSRRYFIEEEIDE
ncbi:MAG: hypothetical protein FWD66_06415 [Paludibacter sp.]|nr:hypothetical protein [Paludibacter sp.]